MATFNPPVNPSYNSPQDVAERIKRADFGDGYTQRTSDGINERKENWNLSWDTLKDADANTIISSSYSGLYLVGRPCFSKSAGFLRGVIINFSIK